MECAEVSLEGENILKGGVTLDAVPQLGRLDHVFLLMEVKRRTSGERLGAVGALKGFRRSGRAVRFHDMDRHGRLFPQPFITDVTYALFVNFVPVLNAMFLFPKILLVLLIQFTPSFDAIILHAVVSIHMSDYVLFSHHSGASTAAPDGLLR